MRIMADIKLGDTCISASKDLEQGISGKIEVSGICLIHFQPPEDLAARKIK